MRQTERQTLSHTEKPVKILRKNKLQKNEILWIETKIYKNYMYKELGYCTSKMSLMYGTHLDIW